MKPRELVKRIKRGEKWMIDKEALQARSFNNDLLPCPFCGDKPKFKTTFGRRHQAGIHQIACDCCGIRTREFGSTDGARHYWNMRAR